MEAFYGILIPFLGTSLGAACVFFLRKTLSDAVQRALTGFAAGVMVAASVWSLLIPAIEQSAALSRWSFFPAVLGFWAGILFLLALDHIIPHLHAKSGQAEGPKSRLQRTTMMMLAVTLHNIPEGMSAGLSFSMAGLSGDTSVLASAVALAIGLGIQNIPEGAAVALPLLMDDRSKAYAFGLGVLSGLPEPVFGLLAAFSVTLISPLMPWLLAFTAGAMMYVVAEELVPAAHLNEHSDTATLSFSGGFLLMMVLDVALS